MAPRTEETWHARLNGFYLEVGQLANGEWFPKGLPNARDSYATCEAAQRAAEWWAVEEHRP